MNGATQTKRSEKMETRLEIAEKIADANNGRVWAPEGEDGIIRIYIGKRGYAQVEADGVNIDAVGGHDFEDVRDSVEDIGLSAYRR
jgi:hypothetical protein